jgi:hypothetical protein
VIDAVPVLQTVFRPDRDGLGIPPYIGRMAARAWLLLAAVAALATAGGAGAETAAPKVIVQLQGRVLAVAQDGPHIAWAVGPCGAITIRDLASGKNYGFSGALCDVGGHFGALALGGSQAEWWTDWQGDDYHQDLALGSFGGKANDPALETQWTECGAIAGDGDVIPALGAANGHVFYSYDLISAGPNEAQPCQTPVKKSGGVYDATTNKHLAGTPPALDFAASGTEIALVPLDPNPKANTPSPAGHAVQVYDTGSGKLVATAAVTGNDRALSLSTNVLAVLAKSPAGLRLETFDPSSGSALAAVALPATAGSTISASGGAVVYSLGTRIWSLDARTGKRTPLATAGSAPVGLSIQGNRLVWGENAAGHGRIVSLTV